MRRRVLCDRHQADLLYSLQLLFENRLGYDLYVPVGHEWWDEGYWRFGEVFGDDRLAQQYLTLDAHWQESRIDRGLYVTWDKAHPDRPIYGATLEAVRASAELWSFVVATVQENQPGFHRFAGEIGARYVLQVGNNNQRIDWALDPLALVSSSAPIEGRGVHYHQEFDSDGTFAFIDARVPDRLQRMSLKSQGMRVWCLDHRRQVGSFVNCMPQIHCWPVLERIRAALPEFRFCVYGIDGPDGNLEGTRTIADAMRHCGWGWHDKPQGDGFGHVLHGWAAIGRPLIGHASHYRGCLGEAYWIDGVTCVDLDQRDDAGNAALIREISEDADRWLEMTYAIRSIFDQRVNYEREAAAIRELLET